jgi:hypothetical protein
LLKASPFQPIERDFAFLVPADLPPLWFTEGLACWAGGPSNPAMTRALAFPTTAILVFVKRTAGCGRQPTPDMLTIIVVDVNVTHYRTSFLSSHIPRIRGFTVIIKPSKYIFTHRYRVSSGRGRCQ